MNKKKLIILIAGLLVLMIPFGVYASTNSDSPVVKQFRGFFGIDESKLTDAQKADINDYINKAAELRKEFLNKMVEDGAITRAQADSQIARIDEAVKNGNAHWLLGGGFGKEKGHKMPNGKPGFKRNCQNPGDCCNGTNTGNTENK